MECEKGRSKFDAGKNCLIVGGTLKGWFLLGVKLEGKVREPNLSGSFIPMSMIIEFWLIGRQMKCSIRKYI